METINVAGNGNGEKIIAENTMAPIKRDFVYKCSFSIPISVNVKTLLIVVRTKNPSNIWKIKPDLIIETGIARGGSLIYYASLLELIKQNGLVLGIDIDIRKHNRDAITDHSMNKRIKKPTIGI